MTTSFKVVALACILVGSVAGQTAHAPTQTKESSVSPLPSGQMGPLPQIPLDSIPPVPPEVTYRDGDLTIVAPNSTLSDILRCIRDQTGAEMEIPVASDRVATRFRPGPVRRVLVELLNGSHFNYVLVGSLADVNSVTRVVLLPKTVDDVPVIAHRPAVPTITANREAVRANREEEHTAQQEAPVNPEVIASPPPAGAVELTDER